MRKLKLLAISTLTTIALTMALTLAACGGDPGPSESQSERPTNQETASISQPATPILDPLPTKPIRLTNLGTSTPEPARPTRSKAQHNRISTHHQYTGRSRFRNTGT